MLERDCNTDSENEKKGHKMLNACYYDVEALVPGAQTEYRLGCSSIASNPASQSGTCIQTEQKVSQLIYLSRTAAIRRIRLCPTASG